MYANRFGKLFFLLSFCKRQNNNFKEPRNSTYTFMFDGDNKPLKAGHEQCGVKINYKSNFRIMREISALGQSLSWRRCDL